MDRSTFREELNRQLIRFSNSNTIMVEARAVADTFRRLIDDFDDLDDSEDIRRGISALQTLYVKLREKVDELKVIVAEQDDRIEKLEDNTEGMKKDIIGMDDRIEDLEKATEDLEDIRKDIVDMDAVRGQYVHLTSLVSRHEGILKSIGEAFK